MTISVIIPVFNEEAILPAFLNQTASWPVAEVILVDGGSRDQSRAMLLSWLSNCKEGGKVLRSLVTQKGRGNQMNEGARVATGDLLLFLHADSIMESDGFKALYSVCQNTDIVGGAFRLKINAPSRFLKWVSIMANLRSSLLGLPYGDQGIFVRRDIFNKLGGYADFPLMEDVQFIRRLRREGRIALLDKTITTSARRWNRQGAVFTSLRNVILLLLYFMGVSPKQLAKWYD